MMNNLHPTTTHDNDDENDASGGVTAVANRRVLHHRNSTNTNSNNNHHPDTISVTSSSISVAQRNHNPTNRQQQPFWWSSMLLFFTTQLPRQHGRTSTISASARLLRFLILSVGLVFVTVSLYQMAWTYWLPGVFAPPDTELNLDLGRTVTRRRPDRMYTTTTGSSNNNNEPQSNNKRPHSARDGILEGHLTLIDITIPPRSVFQSIRDDTTTTSSSSSSSQQQLPYSSDITATFCHIAWDLQDDNPSLVPTFVNLQRASPLCAGTTITVELNTLVQQAHEYDDDVRMLQQKATTKSAATSTTTVSVPPTAVIFHAGKSGSTVVSNAFAAYRPHHTRVYSEHTALTKTLLACRSTESSSSDSINIMNCDTESHTQLIKDVFFIMGRVTRPTLPQYVFYKLSSNSVEAMSTLTHAMPSTPWMFVYRNALDIMESHFHWSVPSSPSSRSSSIKPDCLRDYGKPMEDQSMDIVELVQRVANTTTLSTTFWGYGERKSVVDLSPEEYCAAHIAVLCTNAVQEYNRLWNLPIVHPFAIQPQVVDDTDTTTTTTSLHDDDRTTTAPPHWLINYDELPFVLWETVLPALVVGPIAQDDIKRMRTATQSYSHGGDTLWKGDEVRKHRASIPESASKAVQLFVDPIYEQMEMMRRENHRPEHPSNEEGDNTTPPSDP